MKAIILAAGRGSRMGALTDDKPKCLIEFRGKPLLEWQMLAFREAGVTDIAIVTGYKRESLHKHLMHEFFNPRWHETNMVSSLECAHEWLKEAPCIVSYSDIYYKTSAVQKLQQSDNDLALTYDPDWHNLWAKRFSNPLSDAETFVLNKENHVLEIGNSADSIDEIQGQYMGLLKITPKAWHQIVMIRNEHSEAQNSQMHMTNLLQKVIDGKLIPVTAIKYSEGWMEIDSASDLNITP